VAVKVLDIIIIIIIIIIVIVIVKIMIYSFTAEVARGYNPLTLWRFIFSRVRGVAKFPSKSLRSRLFEILVVPIEARV
jgi:hypothetical protein